MNPRAALAERLPVFLICTAVVTLIDLPFRAIGFLGLIPTAGPKNMLPLLFGLMFGPAGSLANAAGILLSAMVRGAFTPAAFLEAALTAAVAWLCWSVWYLPGIACIPSMKKPRGLFRYLLFALCAGCALGAGLALLPAARYGLAPLAAGVQVAGSSFAWSLLVGIPSLITLTSVLSAVPVMPRSYWERGSRALAPDLSLKLTRAGGMAGVGDAVEEFYVSRNIPAKRGYAVMSCVEEISVLLLEKLPEGEALRVDLRAGDNVTVRFTCGGPRYNPLAVKRAKRDSPAYLDALGILLVREMAVVAGYARRHGVNRVKIVV
ncbi:MAG TPA: hypothetical protein VN366_04345 [Feifaniaceae bacterium]|nr:hypothetical protein [Feifaniaceae bacterium]